MDAEHETEQSSGYAEDTTEELLEQAQSNGQATIIATIAFLTEHRLPIADWIASLGRTFALAWDEPEPWDAGEFPDAELCAIFGVDPALVAAFNDIPASLAADRSLSWEWFRTGEETRYSVRK